MSVKNFEAAEKRSLFFWDVTVPHPRQTKTSTAML
jgi:hypothetical protein